MGWRAEQPLLGRVGELSVGLFGCMGSVGLNIATNEFASLHVMMGVATSDKIEVMVGV